MIDVRRVAATSALAALSSVAPASASGTVTVHHASGVTDTYPGAMLAIVGKTLHVRSADRKGTLIIERASCYHQGPILTCLPTRVTLKQHGTSRLVDLEIGTVYYNPTTGEQKLPYSSRQMAPHAIVLSLTTERGTIINVDGTVDSGASK